MQDALELSTVMLDPESGFIDKTTGRPNITLPTLLEAEEKMLKRKAEFNQMRPRRAFLLRRDWPDKVSSSFEWTDVFPGDGLMTTAMRTCASTVLPPLSRMFVRW